MLFVVFQIGKDAYAMDVADVVQIVPLVRYKQIPLAPAGLAGLFDYHGTIVPLVDLSEIALGHKAENKMSTRIILANFERQSGEGRLIGLIAEQVVETLRCEQTDFVEADASAISRYWGPITMRAGRMIQQIRLKRLLSAASLDQLFCEVAGTT